MAELIIPDVYIDVRPEALIVGGPISVGNIGIVGTAAAGSTETVEILSNFGEATEKYGPYDAFNKDASPPSLSLVRAIEIAFNNGASTIFAIRVADDAADKGPNQASVTLEPNSAVVLTAKAPGSFGNKAKVKIEDDPVDQQTAKVTLTYKNLTEVYKVNTAETLMNQINEKSAIATAKDGKAVKPANGTKDFAGGRDGASASTAAYVKGLQKLFNENVHIIVAAGLDDSKIGAELKAHVESASTDKFKRDRIAVVGSALPATKDTKPSQFSDRLIFVAPGIKVTDSAKAEATPDDSTVTLPGSYAAAAIAGMLSARDPHISLTNKSLSSVKGLEQKFDSGQLAQLIQSLVLVLEERKGVRVVKAITTDSGAFRQITTRRIVDFAKFGVRSAAEPYIGLLNNDRVRKALKGSINGFLAQMVDDEMLVSYELDVSATRDDEIRGIAKVTMTVRPTFSIDYIKVTMFLG